MNSIESTAFPCHCGARMSKSPGVTHSHLKTCRKKVLDQANLKWKGCIV